MFWGAQSEFLNLKSGKVIEAYVDALKLRSVHACVCVSVSPYLFLSLAYSLRISVSLSPLRSLAGHAVALRPPRLIPQAEYFVTQFLAARHHIDRLVKSQEHPRV